MKTALKALAAGSLVLVGSMAASLAFASGANGVSCPAGSDGTFQNGVMKCRKVYTELRASVCPIGMVMNSTGADKCESLTNGPTVDSKPQLFPTDPANPTVDRQLDAGLGSLDRFRVTFTKFEFPNGALFVGNPDRGAHCPAGSTAKPRLLEGVAEAEGGVVAIRAGILAPAAGEPLVEHAS